MIQDEPLPAAPIEISITCKSCNEEWKYKVKEMPQLAFDKRDKYLYYVLSGKPLYCIKCNSCKCILTNK